MHRVTQAILLWAISLVFASAAWAQGSRADYERAADLRRKTENTVFRDRVRPNWLPGAHRFWYRVRTDRDRHAFVLVDAERGWRGPMFDHERLATALSKRLQREVRAAALPLQPIEFDDQAHELTFAIGGRRFHCDLRSYEIEEIATDGTQDADLPVSNRAPRRSRSSEEETEIVFVNQTSHELSLIWRDYEGGRWAYGTVKPGATHRQHTFTGHVWEAANAEREVLAVFVANLDASRAIIPADAKPAPPLEPATAAPPGTISPDGHWSARLRDNNVWLRKLATRKADSDESKTADSPDAENPDEIALSSDGTAEDPYQGPLVWSPDSSKLLALQVRPAQQHTVYLIESSPSDQVQPKLHTLDYLKPGDAIAHPRPRLFDVASRRGVPISDELFARPWSIDHLRWDNDSRRFTFLYNQRGHQALRVIAVDAESGSASTVIDEASPTFIEYNAKLFYRPIDQTGEILWMSERDGWNHLYRYDPASTELKQITRGQWVVRRVEHVDAEKRQIWFYAGGVRSEQDPYYLHLCRINFDGEAFTVLTQADGTHEIEFSPDRRYFLDRWSRVDQPPIVELRRSDDGGLLCEVERADTHSLLATGWTVPERFAAPGRDGETEVYGIIIRPSNFDEAKKYPVVEQIYAGPHGAHVPKVFGTLVAQHALAELGFIVVQIDGMGTNWRSKAFHDVCWRNLADAGFADRIAWLKAASAARPWVDLSRVGVYGGSAGGQNAVRALLDHHEFYKVAVADCGCHDNRMDKIWWNELWTAVWL